MLATFTSMATAGMVATAEEVTQKKHAQASPATMRPA